MENNKIKIVVIGSQPLISKQITEHLIPLCYNAELFECSDYGEFAAANKEYWNETCLIIKEELGEDFNYRKLADFINKQATNEVIQFEKLDKILDLEKRALKSCVTEFVPGQVNFKEQNKFRARHQARQNRLRK